jgi:uncharacterized HAD superfamily protein
MKIALAKTKISFDYDGTLSTTKGKELAAEKLADGHDVWIITARQKEDNNNAVYTTAERLGIPRSRIKFTNGQDKWKWMQRYDIDIHYDNNLDQVNLINERTLTRAILFS